MIKSKVQRIADYLLMLDQKRDDFDAFAVRERKDGRHDIIGFDVDYCAFGEIKRNKTLIGVKDFS